MGKFNGDIDLGEISSHLEDAINAMEGEIEAIKADGGEGVRLNGHYSEAFKTMLADPDANIESILKPGAEAVADTALDGTDNAALRAKIEGDDGLVAKLFQLEGDRLDAV